MMWHHWHEGIGSFGGWYAGAIIGLVLLVVIIGLAIWGIVTLTRHSRREDNEDNALAIAKERYAKGEINKEEFDQIKRDLS